MVVGSHPSNSGASAPQTQRWGPPSQMLLLQQTHGWQHASPWPVESGPLLWEGLLLLLRGQWTTAGMPPKGAPGVGVMTRTQGPGGGSYHVPTQFSWGPVQKTGALGTASQ